MKIEGLRSIMLVDDDDMTNFIHTVVIEESGIEAFIKVATTVQEALDYLKSCQESGDMNPKPGIIFLDINMPGMSGWDFLDKYRTLPEEKRANIIIAMLTTSLNPDDRKRGENNVEIKKFYHKPLTQDMLHEVINLYSNEGSFPRNITGS